MKTKSVQLKQRHTGVGNAGGKRWIGRQVGEGVWQMKATGETTAGRELKREARKKAEAARDKRT